MIDKIKKAENLLKFLQKEVVDKEVKLTGYRKVLVRNHLNEVLYQLENAISDIENLEKFYV